jgi:hypothetical protein
LTSDMIAGRDLCPVRIKGTLCLTWVTPILRLHVRNRQVVG